MTKIADCELRIAELGPNPKSEIRNSKFSSFVDRKQRTVSRPIGFGTVRADPTGQGRQRVCE